MWLHERLARDDSRRGALLKFIGSESIRLGNSIVHDAEVEFAEFSRDGELLLTAVRESGEAPNLAGADG